MDALTINLKRGDRRFSLSYSRSLIFSKDSDFLHDLYNSKKPKISPMNHNPERHLSSSLNIVSRISRYPKEITRSPREVHAPCRRKLSFGRRVSLNRDSIDEMGNCLNHRRYDEAKSSSAAFESLKNVRKDKAPVIDVEAAECSKFVISDVSNIEEEIEVLDDDDGRDAHVKLPASCRKLFSSSAVSELTKVDDDDDDDKAGEMMASLSLSRGDSEELVILPHKKLYEFAERRNPNLNRLDSEINFLHSKWSLIPKRKPAEDVPRELFVPLTPEEEVEVSQALSDSNRRKVLVTHENSNIEITGQILQCLRPRAWLNDEVVNIYFELLKEREKREPNKFLKCHFFNTFFYKKLISGKSGYDFKAVRRWTTMRKLGYSLVECDKIFVPIHKERHWCLAVINKKDEKFQYLDSLKGMDSQVLKILASYFEDEVKYKNGKGINVSSWKYEYVGDLPEQMNGSDCGMFMIKYADFYSRGLGLCFNQEHMPYFRLRTAKEILRLKAE